MYAPRPNSYTESYTITDFESVHFKPPRQTAGPEFYDRSNFSRMVGLVGVGVATLFGGLCIFAGLMMFLSKNTIYSGVVVIPLRKSWEREFISLGLNLIVTGCTEAIGFVHGIALRSALASQRRLRFNTNLRLLSAASGWFNPNGTSWNVVMAILLIISYSSSLLVTLSVSMNSSSSLTSAGFAICVSDVPVVVLGVALLAQVVIALVSVWVADILTWSSSPFDMTAALVHHAQIIPELGRCMRGVGDTAPGGPLIPSLTQPSAWRAHASVRKVVTTLWVLLLSCVVWGIIIMFLSYHDMLQALGSWSFFPRLQSHFVAYSIPLARTSGLYGYWVLCYVNMAVIQGPLTLALHCSELVVNVIRDECLWRKATTKNGTTISSSPLALVFGSPLNIALLAAKPVLHWMLGLAISLAGTAENGLLTAIGVSMWPCQILNYSGALLIVSIVITVVVLYRPRGPQPAAYGHVQTLANLIDEWSSTMWWGHKEGGFPFRHAGTSDRRLPEVDMNMPYA